VAICVSHAFPKQTAKHLVVACANNRARARAACTQISRLSAVALARPSKLFDICQGSFFASLSPSRNDALSQVMLWPYLLRRYKATSRRNSRRGNETVHRCRPIPAAWPPRPFADLIYGAILMPKNTMHRPRVPPRDSKRFLAFPDSLALARFFIVSSLAFPPSPPSFRPVSVSLSLSLPLSLPEDVRVRRISRARTPTERVSPLSMARLRETSAEKSAAVRSHRSAKRAFVCARIHSRGERFTRERSIERDRIADKS